MCVCVLRTCTRGTKWGSSGLRERENERRGNDFFSFPPSSSPSKLLCVRLFFFRANVCFSSSVVSPPHFLESFFAFFFIAVGRSDTIYSFILSPFSLKKKKKCLSSSSSSVGRSSSYFSRPFLPFLFLFGCCLRCKSSRRYQDKLLSPILSCPILHSSHYHFHPRNFIFPFKGEEEE